MQVASSSSTTNPTNDNHNYDLNCSSPCVPGDESIMSIKEHGTSHTPVQSSLRFGANVETADLICNFNRRIAEYSGYFQETAFLNDVTLEMTTTRSKYVYFYDSNTGKHLFSVRYDPETDYNTATAAEATATSNTTIPSSMSMRTFYDFYLESMHHGWPSFRDNEVNWENVRVLPNGETVSVDGTHLGHDLPDEQGNRYCLNLLCIAGKPAEIEEKLL